MIFAARLGGPNHLGLFPGNVTEALVIWGRVESKWVVGHMVWVVILDDTCLISPGLRWFLQQVSHFHLSFPFSIQIILFLLGSFCSFPNLCFTGSLRIWSQLTCYFLTSLLLLGGTGDHVTYFKFCIQFHCVHGSQGNNPCPSPMFKKWDLLFSG